MHGYVGHAPMTDFSTSGYPLTVETGHIYGKIGQKSPPKVKKSIFQVRFGVAGAFPGVQVGPNSRILTPEYRPVNVWIHFNKSVLFIINRVFWFLILFCRRWSKKTLSVNYVAHTNQSEFFAF